MFQSDFTGIGTPLAPAWPPALRKILERGMVQVRPDDFVFKSKGKYRSCTDRRGLVWLEHPLEREAMSLALYPELLRGM